MFFFVLFTALKVHTDGTMENPSPSHTRKGMLKRFKTLWKNPTIRFWNSSSSVAFTESSKLFQGSRKSDSMELVNLASFYLRQEILARWTVKKWKHFVLKRRQAFRNLLLSDMTSMHSEKNDCFKKLQEVANFLHRSQEAARKYALTQTVLAREYFLKAMYKEQRENFKLSLTIEPPLNSLRF